MTPTKNNTSLPNHLVNGWLNFYRKQTEEVFLSNTSAFGEQEKPIYRLHLREGEQGRYRKQLHPSCHSVLWNTAEGPLLSLCSIICWGIFPALGGRLSAAVLSSLACQGSPPPCVGEIFPSSSLPQMANACHMHMWVCIFLWVNERRVQER